MMYKKQWLILLIGLIGFSPVIAQVKWSSFTSGNYILAMLKVNNEIWIGSYGGGLVRFNTQTKDTSVYLRINSGIKNNQVTALAVDNQDNIILAVYNEGIIKFDKNKTWTMLFQTKKFINALAVDASGVIWVASIDGAYKIENGVSSVVNGLPDPNINCVAIDNKGIKWFGVHNNGLIKYDNNVLAIYNGNSVPHMGDEIVDIKFDNQGAMWLAADYNGMLKYDGLNWISWHSSGFPTLKNENIRKITFDPLGNTWLSSRTGVLKFNGTLFTAYKDPNLLGPRTADIIVDNNGNKWVGIEELGLYRFNDTTFLNYNIGDTPLPISNAICMAEDKNGKKWFATNSSLYGISSFDGSDWERYHSKNSAYPSNHCWAIAIDKDANVYTASNDGLYKFDGMVWSRLFKNLGAGSTVKFDKKGNLWAITDSGIVKFDGINWQTLKYGNLDQHKNIAFDKSGNAWFTSYSKGVFKYNGNTFTNYSTTNSGIISNAMTTICVDSADNIWVGGENGLSEFNGKNWKNYTKGNCPLPTNAIRNINTDAHKNIWISTNSALIKYHDSTWTVYDSTNSPLYSGINSVSIDGKGNKWVAVDWGGYLIMNGDDVILKDEDIKSKTSLINVYPNPAQEMTQVQFKHPPAGKCMFTLYDLTGKAIAVIDNILVSTVTINLQNITKGMYLYIVTDKNSLIGTGKLIIR